MRRGNGLFAIACLLAVAHFAPTLAIKCWTTSETLGAPPALIDYADEEDHVGCFTLAIPCAGPVMTAICAAFSGGILGPSDSLKLMGPLPRVLAIGSEMPGRCLSRVTGVVLQGPGGGALSFNNASASCCCNDSCNAPTASAPVQDTSCAKLSIVDWTFGIPKQDDPQPLYCGTKLTFKISGVHDVVKVNGNTCSRAGGEEIRGVANGGEATYTFTEEGKVVSLICTLTGHCTAGNMKRTYVVVPGTCPPATQAPTKTPEPTKTPTPTKTPRPTKTPKPTKKPQPPPKPKPTKKPQPPPKPRATKKPQPPPKPRAAKA